MPTPEELQQQRQTLLEFENFLKKLIEQENKEQYTIWA